MTPIKFFITWKYNKYIYGQYTIQKPSSEPTLKQNLNINYKIMAAVLLLFCILSNYMNKLHESVMNLLKDLLHRNIS